MVGPQQNTPILPLVFHPKPDKDSAHPFNNSPPMPRFSACGLPPWYHMLPYSFRSLSSDLP
jgi:hypothetical protein